MDSFNILFYKSMKSNLLSFMFYHGYVFGLETPFIFAKNQATLNILQFFKILVRLIKKSHFKNNVYPIVYHFWGTKKTVCARFVYVQHVFIIIIFLKYEF